MDILPCRMDLSPPPMILLLNSNGIYNILQYDYGMSVIHCPCWFKLFQICSVDGINLVNPFFLQSEQLNMSVWFFYLVKRFSVQKCGQVTFYKVQEKEKNSRVNRSPCTWLLTFRYRPDVARDTCRAILPWDSSSDLEWFFSVRVDTFCQLRTKIMIIKCFT